MAIASRSDAGAARRCRSAGWPAAIVAGADRSPAPPSVTDAQASAGERWAVSTISAGRLERARPAQRVERILQVVGAGGDDDAGVEQRPHRGEPAGHRLLVVAALEVQVRRRQGDDGDAGGGDGLGDRPLPLGRLHAEADAVARRDRAANPVAVDERGEVGEPVDGRRRASRRCAGRRRRRARRRSRGTISVAARVPPASRCGQPPTRSAPAASASRSRARWSAPRRPGDRPAAQGDDLDVDHVGDAAAHLDERLDAAQPVVERRVGVGAHGA